MHRLKIRITAEGPLVLSKLAGDANMVRTRRYLSGSVVRGLVAGQMLKNLPLESRVAHQDVRFQDPILSGRLIFTNATIAEGNDVYQPLARALQQRKRSGDALLYNMMVYQAEEFEPVQHKPAFVQRSENILRFKQVETELSFHHQRDRSRGVSREGFLFNYESIAAGQSFCGEIRGPAELLEQIRSAVGNNWIGFAGRSRTAQYGRVNVCLDNELQPVTPHAPRGREVMLTLLSDTIIYNRYGFPSSEIPDFAAALGEGIKVITQKTFVATDFAESFVSVWGMKRPSEVVLSAGSCFLLDTSNAGEQHLKDLVAYGIGERRQEGFGQCLLESGMTEVLELYPEDYYKSTRPTESIPEELTQLLAPGIEREYEIHVVSLALEAAGGSGKIPSNSLLGRLQRITGNRPWKEIVWDINCLRLPAARQLKAFYPGQLEKRCHLFDALATFTLDTGVVEEINNVSSAKLGGKAKELAKPDTGIRWEEIEQKIQKAFTGSRIKQPVNRQDRDRELTALKEIKDLVARSFKPVDVFTFKGPHMDALNKLCKEIGYTPKHQSVEGRDNLNRLFLTTLLTSLRKD